MAENADGPATWESGADDDKNERSPKCTLADPPPPGFLDLQDGWLLSIGPATEADCRAAAAWLERNYPERSADPATGDVGPIYNMTWTKLGDEFPAEARDLTSDEFRTHVEALCWSNFRLLDLRVPKADVRRFAEVADADQAVKGLVAKGWWADCADVWDIGLMFAEWQEERVVVDKRRDDAATRKRRSRLHKAGDHSLCLPGGACPHVTGDTTRDGTRDETRRPGRVGTGPTDPPDPLIQDQDQSQDRKSRAGGGADGNARHVDAAPVKDDSVAKSQNRRLPDGPDETSLDANLPATGTTTGKPQTARASDSGDSGFAEFWDAYPRKIGRNAALPAWRYAVNHGADPARMTDAAQRFAGGCRRSGTEERFIPHPKKWLIDERWLDEPPPPPQRRGFLEN